jgi:hypothetical protein
MRIVLRLLVCFVLLALVGAGAALAAQGDPQKKLTSADNARARAMLLKKADLGPGFSGQPASDDFDFYCQALDESDLTLSGEAKSQMFHAGLVNIGSAAGLYASVSDANASWKRGTSAAGVACISSTLKKVTEEAGAEFVSFRKIPFPAVAPRTVAFRWTSVVQGIRLYADWVYVARSRAQAALFFASAPAPAPKASEARLARLIAGRMASALSR